MTRTIQLTRDSYIPLPDGFYRLKLRDISDGGTSQYRYSSSPFLFIYDVVRVIALDAVGAKVRVRGKYIHDIVPPKTARNTKLGRIASALMGRPHKVGDVINLNDLIGHECVALIIQNGHCNHISEYYTEQDYDAEHRSKSPNQK